MLNRIQLHGYFGHDPELTENQAQDGSLYKTVKFSIGVSRDFGDETDWFFCVLNGKRAEVIDKYFHKGSEIFVEGRLEKYKPKKDPEHTADVVKVTNFDFCGKQNNGEHARGNSSSTASTDDDAHDTFEGIDEDVPF